MRRAVFVIALITGIVSGVFSLWAQTVNIEGDSKWPDTAIVDEPPPAKPQQARPRPVQSGSEQSAAPSAAVQPQAPSSPQPSQAATSSARPARNPSAQQRPRAAERESEPRTRRQPASEPGNDETATLSPPVPPVPVRREAAAPAAIVPVVAPQASPTAAQAEPAAPQLLPVAVPVAPRQPAPLALNLMQTPPAPVDDGLGKLIGQMLIVGFQGVAPDESWPRQVAAQIESGKIGGVLLMGHNMLAPDQLAKLNNAFRRTKAQIAPFIAVDQSGGLAHRLPAEKGFQQYASATELGMSNDPLNAYNLYQRMAMELFVYGFNVNLGPVVDLELNGENAAATADERRYGSQPKHVAAFAKAFRLAHHNEGLLTVLKHFPGPANAKTEGTGGVEPDTHWDPVALEPYRQLVAGGNADMVMVGHLSHAEFSDEPGMPASLSKKAIQTRLRDEIGFKGVIISDDLEAKAVASRFPLEESVVRAITAGNDLLLIGNQAQPSPDLPERLTAAIKQAVRSGALTRERLQASYDRIIAAKQSLSQAAREIASAKQTEADEEKPAAP